MAFEKSIHLTDCKYRYTISPNVKKFTLRDTTFVQNKIGNYELHRDFSKKCLTQAKVSHSKSLLTKT